jgi:hypothetical protein
MSGKIDNFHKGLELRGGSGGGRWQEEDGAGREEVRRRKGGGGGRGRGRGYWNKFLQNDPYQLAAQPSLHGGTT